MDYDPTIDGGRLWLIKSTSGTAFFMPPGTLPADKLTEFCQGFADVLVSRAALESA